jgi:hypothetical protein
MTGVPIERRFALLVSFVGDIAQERATAEGCRRNPQAGIASRRRETVDRALQVFSSASRNVIGQQFPGTTGTPRRSGHQRYSRAVMPILPAQHPACRTRLPIEVESLAEEPKSITRSAAQTGEFPALPLQPPHLDLCPFLLTRMRGHSGLEPYHLQFPIEVSGRSSLADLPRCAEIRRCCGAGMQPRSPRHRVRSILAADEVKEPFRM